MAETEVLDRVSLDTLIESLGGDRVFLVELIDTYLADASALFDTMQQALAGGNAEELHRAAHSLKSTSASFGALALASMSRDVEEHGKAGRLDGVQTQVEQMQAEYQRVREALQAMRDQE